MESTYSAYIASNYQDIQALPIENRKALVIIKRRKAYKRNAYTYQIKAHGQESAALSFDRMIVELRDIVSWYKDNSWISSNDDCRIVWDIKIIKQYDNN